MTTDKYKSFALTDLSSGIHCLRFDGAWRTVYASESACRVIGISATLLLEQSDLWIGRIHPSDVDAVRAALDLVQEGVEVDISYRIRDEKNGYRWIGYACKQMDDGTLVGFIRDTTEHKIQQYTDRIHLAGRNALSTFLESADLNDSISKFLQILGEAMVVDSVRLVRFRKDGCAFITHEWVRSEHITKIV